MTLDDVYELFTQISLVDDRVVRADEAELEAQAHMWAQALMDVPLGFAGEAVGRHYADCPFPVKPSDITERWRATTRTRMARDAELEAPPVDPSNWKGYRDSLRAGRAAVMSGAREPSAVGELTRGGPEFVPANPGFLAAKAAMWPPEQQVEPPPELAVHCPYCGAKSKRPCELRGRRQRTMRGTHPSRKDALVAAQMRQQEADSA